MSETKKISYAPYNFSWVVPGKLACMGWPRNVENMRFLGNEGITHLITLSRERRPPVDDFPKGMTWDEIKVKEFEAPSVKQINHFIDVCQRGHFTKDVVGLHCRQGRGRTGVMAACYLIRFQDMSPEMAIIQLRIMRPGSIETHEQERSVMKYYDALRGTREDRRQKFAEMPEPPATSSHTMTGYKKPVHISTLYKYTNRLTPMKTIPNSLPSYVCNMRLDNF